MRFDTEFQTELVNVLMLLSSVVGFEDRPGFKCDCVVWVVKCVLRVKAVLFLFFYFGDFFFTPFGPGKCQTFLWWSVIFLSTVVFM